MLELVIVVEVEVDVGQNYFYNQVVTGHPAGGNGGPGGAVTGRNWWLSWSGLLILFSNEIAGNGTLLSLGSTARLTGNGDNMSSGSSGGGSINVFCNRVEGIKSWNIQAFSSQGPRNEKRWSRRNRWSFCRFNK